MTAEVEKLKAAGRQQDHRAHPYRLHARTGRHRQDPRRRRGGRRPFALAAVEDRSEGRRPVSDDGRQSGRLQGAGRAGGVLFEISRRDQNRLRRQRRRQGGDRRPDLSRQVGDARRGRARPHQGARRADRGAEGAGGLRDDQARSTAAATIAAPANARWATWSSDAILDRVKGQGVQIVFQNGGGLRASIDQGVVTMGEVLTVLPFQNTLSTFQITGKDVVAALENGASQLEEGGGRFAQVAGLKYSFDKSAPVNSRIIGGRGDGRRRMEADRSRQRRIWPRPTTLSVRAATATRSSPRTGRTPMTTVRAWSRCLPTISRRTGPIRPSSTAA